MLLTEYDEARHFQKIKEEGREEGLKEGLKEGRLLSYIELVQSGTISPDIAAQKLGISVEEFISKIPN